ncbi:hypothetical protein C8A00DRAFT_13646 [Chaetomidium leptoderma]|uniref:DUF7136 domain-containing protein n=1 Tax=Chaetomidium leptoderma TaxID=669021 RepID=A0AAN6VQB2_9PEZI|nr:hypothetical protein C8A00DRAFT_13646 [Chaetomidium leptoderma]
MRLPARAVWSLVASLAWLGAIVNAAGVLEVDLVFPRNETYAPPTYMPVIFAFRNPELARHVRPTAQRST